MKPVPTKPKQLESFIERNGFVEIKKRRAGAHRFYRDEDGRTTTISFHPGDIPSGTLKKIVNQIGFTVEQFNTMI